jgi:hypothetical protein
MLVSLRAKPSNLLQSTYLNLRDCFVAEFIRRINPEQSRTTTPRNDRLKDFLRVHQP